MKKYYVSEFESKSGISKYAKDFYTLVLKERGYEHINSAESSISILSTISSRDRVHLELGIFQQNEIELLFLMLNANYRNVSITLHDAPLVRYPYHRFGNNLLNKFSKLIDIMGYNSPKLIQTLKKIRKIYVLTRKGMNAMRNRYGLDNVYFLPHVIDPCEIDFGEEINNNLIYLGFIGKNKGIEYGLKLHQELLKTYPEIGFYVAGTAMGKEIQYYQELQAKYSRNVHYLGYVSETELNEVYRKAGFAIQLFKNYRFFWPVSGSALYSMKKGMILLTNKVNALPEIVDHNKTGFYLSGKMEPDLRLMRTILENKKGLQVLRQNMKQYLSENHFPQIVGLHYTD